MGDFLYRNCESDGKTNDSFSKSLNGCVFFNRNCEFDGKTNDSFSNSLNGGVCFLIEIVNLTVKKEVDAE